MLADSSLPHCFWAEELSTAVYLQNRSLTTAVEGKTLLEAWTGQKPMWDFLEFSDVLRMLLM